MQYLKHTSFFIFAFFFLFFSHSVLAIESVNYETMVTLPKIGGELNTENYIKALYILSIGIAGVLAVIKIIFAGVKYMLSDVVTDKASAKKDIMGALLGLLIVLGAVLLLNTINADLTKLNIFENAPGVSVNIDETYVPPTSCKILSDCNLEEEVFINDATCGRCVLKDELAVDISQRAVIFVNTFKDRAPNEDGEIIIEKELYNYVINNYSTIMTSTNIADVAENICSRDGRYQGRQHGAPEFGDEFVIFVCEE